MSFSLQFSVSKPLPENLENIDQAKPSEISLNAENFKNYFRTITSLPNQIDEYHNVIFNNQKKDGYWLTTFFDQLRKQELQLKEETNNPINRADSWGFSAVESIQKKLPESKQELNAAVFWFQIGRFEDSGIWKVDKFQISAILKQEIEDKFLHLCPSFNQAIVDESINRLPDIIDVYRSPSWEILYENKIEGSKIVKKAVGVIHKLTLNTLIEPRNKAIKKEVSSAISQNSAKQSEQNESKKRSIPAVTFGEIGGINGILQTIREVIELPLKNPALFDYLHIKPHKGVLLFGPPGCGKTMIAKAIANEIQAHFISVKGPELLNKYYGQSEENLRTLFEEASEMQPSIIFFDEIDAIAQKRSSEDNLRIEAKFVNQLLTLMDGIEDCGSVCVIAATNRPELLDSALLRPGRFDYQLNVPKPDKEGCKTIFEINSKKMPVHSEFSSEKFAASLEGLTGAEIAFVAREGAYNCLRRNYTFDSGNFEKMSDLKDFDHLKITEIDFIEALKRIKS